MIVELKSLLPEIAEIFAGNENIRRETAVSPPAAGMAEYLIRPGAELFDEAAVPDSPGREYTGSRITFLLEQLVSISERSAVSGEKTAELLEQQESGTTPVFN